MVWLPVKLPPQGVTVGLVVVLALLIGAGVAIAASTGSFSPSGLTRNSKHATTGVASQARSGVTPSAPAVAPRAGVLGGNPMLSWSKGGGLLAVGSAAAYISQDGGTGWTRIQAPTTALVADPSDINHLVAGGASVQISTDGGRTWTTTPHAPTNGPFIPLAISPNDRSVWFVFAHGQIVRTKDAGASWQVLTTPASVTSPAMVSAPLPGRFFVGDGRTVYVLDNNGDGATQLPALPAGAAVQGLAYAGGDASPILFVEAADNKVYSDRNRDWADSGAQLAGPVAATPSALVLVANDSSQPPAVTRLTYSKNLGQNWQSAHGLPSDQTVDAVTIDPGTSAAYAYTSGGLLYLSTDGGANWALLSQSLATTPG
jgi:photosystem II stability/assembly factor-like uncharacterized protein